MTDPTKNEKSGGFIVRALTRPPTQFSHDVLISNEEITKDTPKFEKSTPNNVVRNSILAGSVSGMASTVILYPMDLLRTSMQAASMTTGAGGGAGLSGGPLQVLRQTIKHGGFRALYTGIPLPLAAQAVYKGTVFSVNNILEQAILDYKRKEKREIAELTLADRLFCGFAAGSVNAGLFVTPVEYVRNQLIAKQTRLAKSSGSGAIAMGELGTSWGLIRDVIKGDGVHTLWRGVGITIVRDGIGVACFFSAMAFSRQYLVEMFEKEEGHTNGGKQPSLGITVASGGFAGLAYWMVSLPFDTVKTWIQSADSSASAARAISPVQALRQIYSEFGLLGVASRLNRGWQVAYGRGIPSSAITISVYSYAYQALEQYNNE